MNKIIAFPFEAKSREKAAEWLMLLEERTLSAAEQAEFKLWLNSSRQNLAAFEEVARVWGKMEILVGMAELFPLGSLEAEARLSVPNPKVMQSVNPGMGWIGAVAAVLLVTVSSVFVINQGDPIADIETDKQRYITEIGETETIGLEDGSIITANTDSELRVSVDEGERRIELTRGEAFFEVEHDPDRPFIVQAGNGFVRAVGTAFSVYKNGDKIEVIVTEGLVQIISNEPNVVFSDRHKPILLEAGQIAEYDETVELLENVDPQELSRQLSWKKGMLAFEGQSLEEVIDEFSR